MKWQGDVVRVELEAAVEDSKSLDVTATPARGAFDPNPALGVGSVFTTRLGLHGRWGATSTDQRRVSLGFEAGAHDRGYTRVTVDASGTWPLGAGSVAWPGAVGC